MSVVIETGNFPDLLKLAEAWSLNGAFYYDDAVTSEWTVYAFFSTGGQFTIAVWATGADPLPKTIPAGWIKLSSPFTVNLNGAIVASD